MNSFRTASRRTAYGLEVFQLHRPYRNADSLQNATRLHHYESDTDFGSFRVGDTFSDSHPTKYLGVIQHVHHWLGEGDDGELVHRTLLYVFDGVA
jgi:hypothetical protein